MTSFVDFKNVWLAYNDELLAKQQFAVEDISLTLNEGEFIAIVGPSGCGKSTFMKLATGLKMPSKGSIAIGGAPVTGPLKISGMAFQAPSLLPWRTTLDNVLLPLEIVEPYRSSLQVETRRVRRESKGSVEERRPGRLRRQVPVAAVRRHAAARVDLPRAGARAEAAAARRTVRRARRLHARRAVVRRCATCRR